MRNLPVWEVGRPFPVMVPLPEVGNPISGTAFTVCYFCFLARAPLQSRAERERRHALPKIIERERPRTKTGLHAHGAQFRYGAQWMTVPELAEPRTGNGTMRMEPSFGTGPSEWPYRNWQSPVLEMVRNESRPVPEMVDCRFGYRTKWKISLSGIQKRTVPVMGAITGNGSAISSNGKLRVWVLTHTPYYKHM